MRRQFISRIWQHFDSLYFMSVSAFTCLHRCAIVSHSPFWPLLSLPLSCVSKSLPLLDSLSCISVPVCLPVVPYSHQTFPLGALSILCLLMAALMLPAPQSDNKNLWFHLSPALWLYVLFFIFPAFLISPFNPGSHVQLCGLLLLEHTPTCVTEHGLMQLFCFADLIIPNFLMYFW